MADFETFLLEQKKFFDDLDESFELEEEKVVIITGLKQKQQEDEQHQNGKKVFEEAEETQHRREGVSIHHQDDSLSLFLLSRSKPESLISDSLQVDFESKSEESGEKKNKKDEVAPHQKKFVHLLSQDEGFDSQSPPCINFFESKSIDVPLEIGSSPSFLETASSQTKKSTASPPTTTSAQSAYRTYGRNSISTRRSTTTHEIPVGLFGSDAAMPRPIQSVLLEADVPFLKTVPAPHNHSLEMVRHSSLPQGSNRPNNFNVPPTTQEMVDSVSSPSLKPVAIRKESASKRFKLGERAEEQAVALFETENSSRRSKDSHVQGNKDAKLCSVENETDKEGEGEVVFQALRHGLTKNVYRCARKKQLDTNSPTQSSPTILPSSDIATPCSVGPGEIKPKKKSSHGGFIADSFLTSTRHYFEQIDEEVLEEADAPKWIACKQITSEEADSLNEERIRRKYPEVDAKYRDYCEDVLSQSNGRVGPLPFMAFLQMPENRHLIFEKE